MITHIWFLIYFSTLSQIIQNLEYRFLRISVVEFVNVADCLFGVELAELGRQLHAFSQGDTPMDL